MRSEFGTTIDDTREPSFDFFFHLVVGYGKAGLCYPFLALACLTLVLIFTGRINDALSVVFVLSGACVFSVILGMLWVVFGVIVAGVCTIFVRTLQISVSPVPFGFVVGGLVGFFAFGLPWVFLAGSTPMFSGGGLGILLLGPLLAMVCCQVGGAMAAQRYLRILAVARWRQKWGREFVGSPSAESTEEKAPKRSIQFSVSQILVLNVWIALMVLLLKQCGAKGSQQIVFQLGVCFVGQIVTYLIWKTLGFFAPVASGPLPIRFDQAE